MKLTDTGTFRKLKIHWPVPLNPNGNDPMFPKNEDGSRDLVRVPSDLRTHDLVDFRSDANENSVVSFCE